MTLPHREGFWHGGIHMDREELKLLRKFLITTRTVMQDLMLPVPPRAPDGWFGGVLQTKEMYDDFNRLPDHLQKIAAKGFFLCTNALDLQTRSANGALIAQYMLFTEILKGTGLPAEHLLPHTPSDRIRASRHLTLVQDPDEHDANSDEVLEIRAEILQMVRSQLLETDRHGFPLSVDNDGDNEDHNDGVETEPEVSEFSDTADDAAQLQRSFAVAASSNDSYESDAHDSSLRRPPWRKPLRMAVLAVAAAALVILAWQVARDWSVGNENLSSASPNLTPVEVDVGDFSVSVQPSRDSEREGQLTVEMANNGTEERSTQVHIGSGAQQTTTGPTVVKPGQTVRRVIQVQLHGDAKFWESKKSLSEDY